MRLYPALLLGAVFICLVNAAVASTETTETSPDKWESGFGNWTETARWSQGLPTPYVPAEVHGNSAVMIPPGTYLAADVEIGFNSADRARVEVDGGQLILMQDSLRVGEYTGGEGEFDLKDGAMHCVMDVFVGAASSVPGRATKATLCIQGGSFLGRTLTVGAGLGAESLLSVEGSHASAVHVLDYIYIEGLASPEGKPGNSTLSFTLDERGVTPITVQSRADGLRIIKDTKSRCRLEIRLSAVPPRDDITLVSAHVQTRGTFDNLPEGSEITAQYQNHTYRWTLTYRGGASGHDMVLKNRSDYPANAPVTHTRPLPEIPKPLWIEHLLFPVFAPSGEPAFVGAEGFGAFTPGGRGGKILYVDNLNDSGPGSLRAAIETSGPRIIHFRIGGVIPLKSILNINEPFVTIDGRDAPGAGIMLRNHGIVVRTHDVVLRYFRIRVGDDDVRTGANTLSYYQGGEGDYALYFIDGARNCIADHLSLSWSTSKMLSTTKGSDLITIQWCILTESLNFADHGYVSLTGGNRVSWHHNLLAHNLSRNVRFQGMVDADFRNNVIYDWGETAAYGEFDRLNYVSNYLKAGPSTTQKPRLFHNGKEVVAPKSIFVLGNIMEGDDKVNQNNWRGMGCYYFDRDTLGAAEPFPAPAVTTEPAQAAYDHVLKDAGATLPKRDAVDNRTIHETREGTGHIIKWVKDAGGWPDFPSATVPPQKEQ
ncbi:MAG: polysaccharide lyase family 1 protein [Limisphaerales bacterium]